MYYNLLAEGAPKILLEFFEQFETISVLVTMFSSLSKTFVLVALTIGQIMSQNLDTGMNHVPKESPVERKLHPCPGDLRHQCPPDSCLKLNAVCKVSQDCCGAANKAVTCRKKNAISRRKQCLRRK